MIKFHYHYIYENFKLKSLLLAYIYSLEENMILYFEKGKTTLSSEKLVAKVVVDVNVDMDMVKIDPEFLSRKMFSQEVRK